MADLPHFDRKMSDAEGLMWRLEKDPHLSSTFANVTILDKAPDFDRLLRRMERATYAVPRLRQRVQPAPVNLSAPMWVDDSNFDLRYHVRHIALPKPGSMRQLLDLASLIACDAYDRTRPLWQFVVVDGLKGGKSALIEKLHHTIVDGEGGVQLSLQFLDFERDAAELPPIDPELIAAAAEAATHEGPSPDLLRDLLTGSLRMPLGLLKQIKELLADPTGIPDAGSAAADTVRGVMQQLGDTEAARSPLWTKRSLHRRMEVLRAPFDETRAAAKRLGGTLNTAFLAAAAEAAGRYASWVPRWRNCARAWRSAPAPKHPVPTLSHSHECWCPRARCRSPIASPPSRPPPARRRNPATRPHWRRWPRLPPRCPPA